MNDFLNQLKDIHLPPEPSWWPPAIGWWLLLILIIIAVVYVYLQYLAYLHSARKLALHELKQLENRYISDQDSRQLLIDLSSLMRRVAMSTYSRKQVASLINDSWIQWIKQHSADNTLDEKMLHTLIEAPYKPTVNNQHIDEIIKACRNWIHKIKKPNPMRNINV